MRASGQPAHRTVPSSDALNSSSLSGLRAAISHSNRSSRTSGRLHHASGSSAGFASSQCRLCATVASQAQRASSPPEVQAVHRPRVPAKVCHPVTRAARRSTRLQGSVGGQDGWSGWLGKVSPGVQASLRVRWLAAEWAAQPVCRRHEQAGSKSGAPGGRTGGLRSRQSRLRTQGVVCSSRASLCAPEN